MNNQKKEKIRQIAVNNDDMGISSIILDNLEYTDSETANAFIEYIQERIYEQDIIYYHKAIDYLATNDASLNKSIEIAINLGVDIEKINSELLATILYQDTLQDELNTLTSDITNVFDEYGEELICTHNKCTKIQQGDGEFCGLHK